MGKKRKASSRSTELSGPRELDERDAKLASLNSYRDVADSEDEFHLNRDEVLLGDGPDEKRRRKWGDDDEVLEASDQEVLGYAESDEDDEDEEEEEEDVDKEKASGAAPVGPTTSQSDSEDDAAQASDDLGDWGASKRDYYNADQIETEADAQAEEEEARRIQQKRLQEMNEADFAFDEDEWMDPNKHTGEEEAGVVTETLPEVEITDDMSSDDRLKILKTRYPEFEPLAQEFVELQPVHDELSATVQAVAVMTRHGTTVTNGTALDDPLKPAAAMMKYHALIAYLGALSMYFALLTSPSRDAHGNATAMPVSELREHAVMDTLVRCRQLWQRVKDLEIPDVSEAAVPHIADQPALVDEGPATSPTDGALTATDQARQSHATKKPTKAQRARLSAEAAASARRAQRIAETEADLASLTHLSSRPRKPTNKASSSTSLTLQSSTNPEAEATSLTPTEAVEKARRKKDLRFYTSQIAQKSARRDQAGKDAGGDADLPYRERLKDRQARLNREAEARGKKKGWRDDDPRQALGGESDSGDEGEQAAARDLRDEEDDGYYDMVAARAATTKAQKADARAVPKSVRLPEDVLADGKRAIGYKIEKNKGLTPKRKKEVRNPRVKKRMKFEEKKKKLGSVRQVYKAGGEGKGGYGGEKTGIKGGLVRSVKL